MAESDSKQGSPIAGKGCPYCGSDRFEVQIRLTTSGNVDGQSAQVTCKQCGRQLTLDELRLKPTVAEVTGKTASKTTVSEASQSPAEIKPHVVRFETGRTPSVSVADLAIGNDAVLEAGRVDLYRVNAFRVTQLPVDATTREIARQTERLRVVQKLGGGASAVSGPLRLEPQPDQHAMREALQRLRDPERRLVDELFWFWPQQLGQGQRDEALDALGRGDVMGAARGWLQQEREGSESNVSMHNLAVLSHATALDLEHARGKGELPEAARKERDRCWPQALKRWRTLLEHEGFWSRLTARIRELDDPRLTTGTVRRMRASLPLALLSINAQLAVSAAERGDTAEAKRHLQIMSTWAEEDVSAAIPVKEGPVCMVCGGPVDIMKSLQAWCPSCKKTVKFKRPKQKTQRPVPPLVEEALRRALEPVRDRIQTLCKAAEAEGDANVEHADRVARRLQKQTEPLLTVIDCLLPAGNPMRDGVHDEVALRALGCQIQHGNKTEEWKTSKELLEVTLPIAASESAKGRIQDNLRIVTANLESQQVYGTCFFCKQNKAEDAAGIEVKMHGEVVRTPTYQGVRITWKHGTIKVPRCGECRAAHEASINWVAWYLCTILFHVFAAVVGLIRFIPRFKRNPTAAVGRYLGLCVAILIMVITLQIRDSTAPVPPTSTEITLRLLFTASMLIGFIWAGGWYGKRRRQERGLDEGIQAKQTRPEKEKNDFPPIQDRLRQGWQFGEQPVG